MNQQEKSEFTSRLEGLVNSLSLENGSDTPDWILAEYLCNCLEIWDKIIQKREKFYGRIPRSWKSLDLTPHVQRKVLKPKVGKSK